MESTEQNSSKSQSVTVEQILNRAHEIISEKGWCQGKGTTAGGKHCIISAIVHSTTELCRRSNIDLIESTKEFVTNKLKLPRPSTLVVWNDTDGRTKEEVLEALTYE